jgi:NADH-quinone oxidoreductase subunit N
MPELNLALNVAASEVTLAIGALVLLLVGAYGGQRVAALVSWLAAALLIAAAAVAANAPLGMVFNGAFVSDPLAVYSKVAIYLASAVAVIIGAGWTGRVGIARFEYPVLVVLSAIGMAMMVSSGDLISLYVGVELHSLALYVLAAYHRDEARASEAGLKYFVLGALSSGLLLYGASLIYGFAGSMRFDEIAIVAAEGGGQTGLIFGLVFLICGLAFKVSAAPFHMWTPDVYEGAPTAVVSFFATAPKFASMILFARVLSEGFGGAHAQWAPVLVIISLFSFAVGAFAGLAQRDLQRLLAYSSIANVGYAILAIAAGTEAGIQAVVMFMTLYMIDTLGFFALLVALSRGGRPIRRIEDFAGLKKDRPVTAIAITVLSLSLLGMPPFAGFWGKVFVFGAAIEGGLWIPAAIGLAASVVAAFYYLRIIKLMWFDAAPEGSVATDPAPKEAQWIGWACAAFSFPLVIIGLTWLDPLTRAAATGFGAG